MIPQPLKRSGMQWIRLSGLCCFVALAGVNPDLALAAPISGWGLHAGPSYFTGDVENIEANVGFVSSGLALCVDRQFRPWIDREDFTYVIAFCQATETVGGGADRFYNRAVHKVFDFSSRYWLGNAYLGGLVAGMWEDLERRSQWHNLNESNTELGLGGVAGWESPTGLTVAVRLMVTQFGHPGRKPKFLHRVGGVMATVGYRFNTPVGKAD